MQVGGCVKYTIEQLLYWNSASSSHTLLIYCIRIGTFNCFRVFGLVQVFQVSYTIITRIRFQEVNMGY